MHLAMRDRTVTYPGGKEGSGVYQRIINLIPPHRVYIEPFLGGGAVLRRKRPARATIGIDADARALDLVRSSIPAMEACTLIHGDAISFLADYEWRGDEFVYCDPPYLMSTRRSGPLYKHEMSDEQHQLLLSTLLTIPAGVMISGYPSELYDRVLEGWGSIDYRQMTRGGGMADERLWLNYSPPVLLHDDRYLGDNFRERERIKRKRARWRRRFDGLEPSEKSAIWRDLTASMREASIAGLSDAAASSLTVVGSHRQTERGRPLSSDSTSGAGA